VKFNKEEKEDKEEEETHEAYVDESKVTKKVGVLGKRKRHPIK